jgi:hypothetical protein
MARDPANRYANARELAVDLEKFAQGRALALGGARGAFQESGAQRAWRTGVVAVAAAGIVLGVVTLLIVQDQKRKRLEKENQRLASMLGKSDPGAVVGGAAGAELEKLDAEARRLASDRDVRARTALKSLAEDARDDLAKKSFDEQVARAREALKDSTSSAVTMFRSALTILPHRWDVRVELGRALEPSEPDAAEMELTEVVLAPDADGEEKLEALIERARAYRALGSRLTARLACQDYAVIARSKWTNGDERRSVLADYALALAETGDANAAENILATLNRLGGDDLARASLARAWILKLRGASPDAIEAELAKARSVAVTDEVRKLADSFGH